MSRPNFNRGAAKTLAAHSIKPPRRTALVWCKRCGAEHRGHCELVPIQGRTRLGRDVDVPHFRRASWPTRKSRRRPGWED